MKKLVLVFLILSLALAVSCSNKKRRILDEDTDIADEDFVSDTEISDVVSEDHDDVTDDLKADPDNRTDEENPDTAEHDENATDENATDENIADEEPDEATDDDNIEIVTVIFVKYNATGLKNGTSWKDAFTDLHSALNAATKGTQIWVASGTYKPTSVHGLVTEDDLEFNRYKHFRMKSGVAIYGGFTGTETKLAQRNFKTEKTILSCETDNCFHIFYHPAGLDLDETAVIDGFSMIGGYANGNNPHNAGGVIHNDGSSLTIKNGVIANSLASGGDESFGGAIYLTDGMLVISDTIFSQNKAGSGGAIHIQSGDLEMTGCTFEENEAGLGGAVCMIGSGGSVTKCKFKSNTTHNYVLSGGDGGAISMGNSQLKIVDSLFSENIANNGGAIYSTVNGSSKSELTVINSVFSTNKMVNKGGAVYLNKTDTNITNAIFFKNTYNSSIDETIGGAIYKTPGSAALNIINSIFKANDAKSRPHMYDGGSNLTVTCSCVVQTTVYDGAGNINGEPLIIAPEGDPLNFGLQTTSPCIDAGSNTPFEAGGFAKDIKTDYVGNDRIIKGKTETPSPVVDMGAVEFKPAP